MRTVLLLVTLLTGTEAFAVTPIKPRPVFGLQSAASSPLQPLHTLRGGTVQSSLATVLSGAMAVPAASGIAAVACSLCYIRQAYVFSLSYGLAMAGIGGAVLLTSPASTLVTAHVDGSAMMMRRETQSADSDCSGRYLQRGRHRRVQPRSQPDQ